MKWMMCECAGFEGERRFEIACKQLLSQKSDGLGDVFLRNFHNKVSNVLGRLYMAHGYDN